MARKHSKGVLDWRQLARRGLASSRRTPARGTGLAESWQMFSDVVTSASTLGGSGEEGGGRSGTSIGAKRGNFCLFFWWVKTRKSKVSGLSSAGGVEALSRRRKRKERKEGKEN